MHRVWLRAAPSLLVAAAALAGSLGACGRDVEPVVSEDALVDSNGYGQGYGYDDGAGTHPPACLDASIAPRWRLSASLHQGLCSSAQIDEVVRCYVTREGDATACRTYFRNSASNSACQRCALSKETATTYGALVIDHLGALRPNVGGCIAEATGDRAPDGCGAKVQLGTQCLRDACASCGADQGGGAGGGNDDTAARCQRAARTSVCAAYDGAAACFEAVTATGAPARACRFEGTEVERARQAVGVFCGP